MRTVYNLCQNDNALSPDMKKDRINDLEIDSAAKTEIKNHIEEGTSIVGKGTCPVPIEGCEEETYGFLKTVIESDDRETIDEGVEEFAALDIDGLQAGITSPILYFLHPIKYSISNDRSRTGMEKYFGYEMSYAFMCRFNFIHVGVPPLTTDDGAARTPLLDPDADDNYSTAWLADNPGCGPCLRPHTRLSPFCGTASTNTVSSDRPSSTTSFGTSSKLAFLRVASERSAPERSA